MDSLTIHQVAGHAPAQAQPGMPPESRVPMEEQPLRRFDRSSRRAFIDKARSRTPPGRRLFVFGGALAVTAFAIKEMTDVLQVGGLTPLEAVVLVFFSLNFAWISLTFVSSIAGTILLFSRRYREKPQRISAIPKGRTAVLMPTYNEQPERVFAAIETMALGVEKSGAGHHFDWFVLSDTTDPDVALAEETAFAALRQRLAGHGRAYYRRRRKNVGRKVGNIADFCRRWGGAYDYLLVLDADSLMTPETIVELALRMDEDPDAGLIQTVPRLVNGKTVLARLQQFAGRVYGPVIAGGLAWWAGSEGNYWGHNAIIRRVAFTGAAGLPVLSGRPPFGGHVLSHDFIEAAFIRRAGWTVQVADDLDGSYEESPPSIVDIAIRDRRWCQGNLQHVRLLGAAGLNWVSRVHILTGIISYIAAPFWLLLIMVGLALALQAQFIRPEYFSDGFQLFPTWPAIDPERALQLLGITGLILFGPKIMGLIVLLADPKARRAAGGTLRVLLSFVFEIIVSALIAPIMMLVQTGIVLSILIGVDAGWKPQRRDDGRIPFRDVVHRHRWHVLSGFALAAAADAVSPVMLLWLTPAIAGLVLAIPISSLTASPRVGRLVRRARLLDTPEEGAAVPVESEAQMLRPLYAEAVAATPDLAQLVRDERRRRAHVALIDHGYHRRPGQIDPVEATAAVKIAEAASLEEALGFLEPPERAMTLATPELFDLLTGLGDEPRESTRGLSAA